MRRFWKEIEAEILQKSWDNENYFTKSTLQCAGRYTEKWVKISYKIREKLSFYSNGKVLSKIKFINIYLKFVKTDFYFK